MTRKIIFITAALLLPEVYPLYADIIYLTNGRTMEGMVLEEKPESILVDIGFGKIGLKRSEIQKIVRSGEAETGQLREKWDRQKEASERRAKEEKAREESAPKHATLGEDHGSLVVDVILNKNTKASLILDTGASLVVIKDSVARQLGIDQSALKEEIKMMVADGRELKAKHAVVASVSVHGMEARNVDVAVLPADIIDPNLKDGMLGMTYLRNFSFKIDHKNKKLILEKSL